MTKSLRVGFFSSKNYYDKTEFSGALYYMFESLKSKPITLIPLGQPKKPASNSISYWLTKAQRKLHRQISQYSQQSEQTSSFIDLVHRQLKDNPCDVIFAPVAKTEVGLIDTKIPILYLSDSTQPLIHNNYGKFNGKQIAHQDHLKACDEERGVINKSTKIIYSSQWAADSAIKDLGANIDKIRIIPFGTNLDYVPPQPSDLRRLASPPYKLLFITGDWQRKGGDLVLEILTLLNSTTGLNSELTIIGKYPDSLPKDPKIKKIPFLDKNVKHQFKQYISILNESHLLLSPTRADCSPLVFGEANAYGVPVVTTAVGGIPEIIYPGKNGYMLPVDAPASEYVTLIAQILSDQKAYQDLVVSSRLEYENRLNWTHWADKTFEVISEFK
jgi:glycosyltransferase involved in cell wall biosynthesis